MAASKDLMVSSGRSHRERVGLERSGSAVGVLDAATGSKKKARHTNGVAVFVVMLK
jgi:hypothetical protein